MRISIELKEAYASAKLAVLSAKREYNQAWKAEPGPKGWKNVDKKLTALEEAEAEERRIAETKKERRFYGTLN